MITSAINDIIVKKDFNSENVKILYEPNNNNNKQDNDNNDNIFVQADRSRLTQVISNLLSNAVKFTKKGTIRVTTQIKEEEEEQDDQNDDRSGDSNKVVVISIKDTGSGISPEMFPRLFSKFASNSFEGTGLGLFIAKSIVEAHGGKIWAENNADGKGATFVLSLPISI